MTSFPRPPVLDPDTLSAEQKMIHDAIVNGPRGVVQGPLRVWLQSAGLADKAQALGAFCRFDTSLPPRLSELAILITGAFWKAGFEWAGHAPIAEKAGVDPRVIEAIRTGAAPSFDHEDEAVLYDFATSLHRDHAVSDAVYARAVAQFGTRTVVELVGILGYYTLISMTINAFRVPLPDDTTDPFAAP
ncbi:MAG: carboxymuconolactone decarboxylase family protein [Rhodobacteraceae bacterium]|jgi:4-carboxymuconolactone decarboxylase|nr:carboxymuconolactone decarboxylase family protein [Paracoccaceae bacterium]